MRQDERSPATTLLEGTSLCDKCALRRMHKTDADVHLDQLRKADKRRGGEIWW
jgi:hypothetical protein